MELKINDKQLGKLKWAIGVIGRVMQELEPKKEEKSNPLIPVIIKEFTAFNPKAESYYGNKKERAAVENLLKRYTQDQVIKAIKYAATVLEQPYAPTITKPSELEDRWVKLVAFKQKEKNREEGEKPKVHDFTNKK